MKAVLMKGTGGTEVLTIGDAPDPVAGEGQLLVSVKAAALNRADLLQRRGLYPPPPGATEILGLEMAGEVVGIGAGVQGWRTGDRVAALLPGGGYAELAAIPAGLAIPLPQVMTFEQGAAIPEAFLTAYLNLVWLGGVGPDPEREADRPFVLVHAGASGIGSAAIQLARQFGAEVLVTAGSEEKLRICLELGATGGWNYKEGSFAGWVAEQTSGRGVDVILDFIGAPYLQDNLRSLAIAGKLLIIGLLGGAKADGLNLGLLMSRRLTLTGTTLRARDEADKIRLTRQLCAFALPRFADGGLRPVIDSVWSWRDVAKAHERMEMNANIGKIVLRID